MKASPQRHLLFHRPTLEQLEDRIAPSSLVGADFNGDGYGDLAIGLPDADVSNFTDAGAIRVVYGSASGVTSTEEQHFNQGQLGQSTGLGEGDQFGWALAAGDFNGDGFDDLAVGVPFDDFERTDGGAVHVLYGSANGLKTASNQLWSQDTPGVIHQTSSNDLFGYALAAGDFDGDGFHDLAVGMPKNDLNNADNAGGVIILYGSSGGLTAVGDQTFDSRTPDVRGTTQAHEHFGWSLAAGDFDNDEFDDLAIGIPDKDWGAVNAGAVIVLYGSADNLSAAGNQLWSQNSSGIQGTGEENDRFGLTLTVGDFNGDNCADLAVGVPYEDVGNVIDAGSVHVIYGTTAGLTSAGNQVWTQNTTGILGGSEANDRFGRALAAGDFNGDGRDDLAVGVPLEDLGATIDAGAVNVIFGSAAGLRALGNELWSQAAVGARAQAESKDYFGKGLAASDFDGDGRADLAIAVPGERPVTGFDNSAFNVLDGDATGLIAMNNEFWS